MRSVALSICLLALGACGVPRAEHEAALAKVDSLEHELDELRHGPERLLARARQAFDSEDYRAVVVASDELAGRHPSTPEAAEAAALAEDASERIARQQREQARRAEAERLAAERRMRQAVAGLWSHTDNVENVTWYYDRESSRYVNSTSRVILYMGRRGQGAPWLRFSVRYKADEWLFIQSYTFNVDGTNYRIDASGFSEVERDNGYGGIWEWYTAPAGPRELEIARAIANSRNAVLRYNGQQYYRDRTISDVEKSGLQKVLDAYEVMSR